MRNKQSRHWVGRLVLSVIALAIIIPVGIVVKNRVETLAGSTLKDAVVIKCTYRNIRGRRGSSGYKSQYTPVAITEDGEKAQGTFYFSPKSHCTGMIGLKTSIYVFEQNQKKNRIGSFLQFWFFPYLILLAIVFIALIAARRSRHYATILVTLIAIGGLFLAHEFGIAGLNRTDNNLATPEGQFDACVTKHLIEADVDGRSQLKKLECTPFPDVSVLSEFPNLEEVYVQNQSFTSIQQLPLPANLKELRIRNPELVSLEGLERFISLESLSLTEARFRSLKELPDNLPLKKLGIKFNKSLENLDGIGRFKNLENLEIERNSVADITEIRQLSKLKILYIGTEPVTDLSPIKSLALLEVARFRNSKAEDFSPLFHKPNMRHAGATGPDVSCEQMKLWMESLSPKRRSFMWFPDHCKNLFKGVN